MNFEITEIRDAENGPVYILSGNGSILYRDRESNTDIGILDVLFDSNFYIYAIKRISDDQEFRIGDILNVGGIRRIISHFKIVKNELNIVTRSNNRIPLAEAVKNIISPTPQRTAPVGTTLADIETRILANNSRPIRLERLLKRRTETPKQFLIKFFASGEDTEAWNLTRDTIFVDDNTVQTPKNKRRSLGDIFMILKYYYPNITLKEVIQLLYVDLMNELHIGLRTSNCSEIHKRVWYYDEEEGGEFMQSSTRDEYGNNKQHYLTSLL